jgi:hypothetical protein
VKDGTVRKHNRHLIICKSLPLVSIPALLRNRGLARPFHTHQIRNDQVLPASKCLRAEICRGFHVVITTILHLTSTPSSLFSSFVFISFQGLRALTCLIQNYIWKQKSLDGDQHVERPLPIQGNTTQKTAYISAIPVFEQSETISTWQQWRLVFVPGDYKQVSNSTGYPKKMYTHYNTEY